MTEAQTQTLSPLDKRRNVVRGMLSAAAPEIGKALGSHIDLDRFIRTCLSVYNSGGDKMAKADPRSFIAAVIEAAQLGLVPGGTLGECFFIARWSNRAGCHMVDFQLGYPGMLKLIRRDGEVLEVVPEIVYLNDNFDVELGTSRGIKHRPWFACGETESGPIVAAYATAKLRDGTVTFKVVTRGELDEAAARSGDPKQSKVSDAWRDFFASMSLKTAVLRLCKWLPLPDAIAHAFRRDEYREAGIVMQDDLGDKLTAAGLKHYAEEEGKAIVEHVNDEASQTQEALKEDAYRKSSEQHYGALWASSFDFFARAGIERDRNKDGASKFKSFIEFAADQGEPYPEAFEQRIYFLEMAKAFVIEWKGLNDEDRDRACDGFVAYLERDVGPS